MAELEQHITELFQKKGWNVELDSFQDLIALRINNRQIIEMHQDPNNGVTDFYFDDYGISLLTHQTNTTLKMLDILQHRGFEKCWLGKQHNYKEDIDEPIICFGDFYDIGVPEVSRIFELISNLIM